MKGYQQAGHGRQGDPAPAQSHQAVYDVGGPIWTFLLGTVKGVKVLRALIVLKIHLNRLGVKDIVHVVSDCQCLRFPHKTNYQLAEGI